MLRKLEASKARLSCRWAGARGWCLCWLVSAAERQERRGGHDDGGRLSELVVGSVSRNLCLLFQERSSYASRAAAVLVPAVFGLSFHVRGYLHTLMG